MALLHELFAAHPILSALQTAFMIWMLIDAYRRRAEAFWFWIILLVPALGAWVYFFAVKLHDFRRPGAGLSLGGLFQRRPSLEELRYHAEQTPTLVNHLNLAQRLMEQGSHAEAVPHLQAALKMEPDHPPCLYCLALCHKEMGNLDAAGPLLESLLARDPRWSNYAGWRLLVAVRGLRGDPGALEACRELARLAPTLENACLLAEHLLVAGQRDEARKCLERALRDHDFAPGYVRRRNRHWAAEARRLRKRAEVEAAAHG
jgi:hypothetical protein